MSKYKPISEFLDKIICGDTLEILKQMPSDSVDCIITSPPYWGLRDYGEATCKVWGGDPDCEHEWEHHNGKKLRGASDGNWKESIPSAHLPGGAFCKKCGAWCGQLGLEPTLDMYIEHLLEITAELKRILKPTGVLWWNHGDCYGGSGKGRGNGDWIKKSKNLYYDGLHPPPIKGITPKCMVLQNYRLILRMVDEQGWILRNIIIWYKPNHMPESVKDRFTNAYEPVFMLTKSKKYWFDLDAVRMPPKTGLDRVDNCKNWKYAKQEGVNAIYGENREFIANNPLGKNPGDLWTIPTQPFPEAHFATFPEKLVEPMIKASCPQWICKKCGKSRERITVGKSPVAFNIRVRDVKEGRIKSPDRKASINEIMQYDEKRYGGQGKATTGWTDCGCNAGWDSGIVLDPFAGSGTTCLVAKKLGRHYIGIDLNPEYCKMARKRLNFGERLEKFGFEFV